MSFNWVYGGGADSYTGDRSVEDYVLLPADVETLHFEASASGVIPGDPPNPWGAGVAVSFDQDYSIVGALPQFRRIVANASIDMAASVSGAGVAQVLSGPSGNQLDFHFNLATPARFRLTGAVVHPSAGAFSYVALQYFNGFNWEYRFWSSFLPGSQGPFDVSGTLVPGLYRIEGLLNYGVYGSASGHVEYHYQLDVFRPGDMNCDGLIDGGDIQGFVEALLSPATYLANHPDCNVNNADMDFSGTINTNDVAPFLQCVLNAGC